MRLYRPSPRDTNRARASLIHHPYLTGVKPTVPVVTVDDVCSGAPVALIKIDVEGHEAPVVRGAAETIARTRRRSSSTTRRTARRPGRADPVRLAGRLGYLMFRVRPARHGITGRVRLALDRLHERPAVGGDFLAISPQAATRLRPLLA